MKNFTNNFKQFTSRLSARWLIMALMMLVGTSSAWAQTWCLAGSFNGWSDAKLSSGKLTVTISSIGEYTFKIKKQGTWDGAYSVDGSRMERNNCSNWQLYTNKGDSKFYADVVGDYTFTFNSTYKTLSITYPPQCTTCCTDYYVAGDAGLCGEDWNANADKMTCSNNVWTKTFTNINNGTYYFQITNGTWDVKKGDYDNSKGNITLSNVDDGYGAKKIKLTTTSKGNITISFDGTKAWVDFEQPCYSSSDVEPGTISSNATNNTICGSGTVELTLSNTTTKDGLTKSIQWQKQSGNTWPDINNANSTTYTTENLSATTIYRAKVTWTKTGCDNIVEYANVTVTVNALPSAPTFTTNSAQVCSGVAFNLNEKFPRNSGEAGNLTWYKSSDDSQVTDPASVTITEATSYYAKATNNNCTSGKSLNCTVNVDTKPTLELASTPTVCPNVEIDLDNYATNTGTLTWYSNQERTTVITDGLVTPAEQTTYYAKVINGTCTPVEKEFTVNVYGIADDMPAYTSTPATSCKRTPNSDGTITLKNAVGGVTYTLDDAEGGSNVWTGLSAGTHTLSALVDACPSLTKEWDVEVGVEDITPTATVSIIGDASFCEGGNTVLTSVVTATQGEVTAYQWYNGEELIQGATASRYTANAAGNYKVVVTVENKGCKDTFNATKEVSVKNKPTTPEFNPDFTSICVGGSTTLASGYNWYTELNASALVDLTVSPQTTTTYYATKVENGCTSDAGEFTVTVNPLPAITAISVNNSSPVINEDVLLTVEGSDIARVEWSITSGTASLSDASGNSVKLTSTASGAVNVTATAISSNGCRATSTKEVTFSETEDCTGNISNDIQIIFYHPSTYNEYNSQKGQWWGMGTMYYSTDKKSWLTKDMGDATSGSKTVTIQNITSEKLYVYFESKWTYHVSNKASTKEDIEELTRGNRYDIRITSHGNDNVKATSEATYTGSLSTPAPLSAPAVKTVSATSEEGSGVVEFTGQIIKTGCAGTSKIYYGYQFKKADEEWPTTGVEASNTPVEGKLIPLTNASETALYYQFSANVENLEDVDYHFRAYIINGYDFTNGNYDQGVYYGLDKLVTVSTVQTPVRTATITLTDEKGNEVDKNKKYCVGETGYIKVTSDVKYTTIKWKTDKGTEIEETGNNGIYPFVAKGDDNIWVMLSNKHNDIDRPAINENPLVVNTFADPILPRVSLNKVSICSNDAVGATVKLTNVVKGQTYQLYQQIENAGGSFTEQAIGEAKTQTEDVTDKTELVLHTLNNTYTTGKYFVKTYTTDCEENKVATQPFTFTVVDAAEVFISIDPASAETTPWMPAKFTVNASDKYTLNVTKGNPAEPATEVEVNQNGNKVSVKIPLPEGSQRVTGQYQNVTFPQGATTQYTITATLSAAGGDNPCAAPTSATINLVPYVEECTIGH